MSRCQERKMDLSGSYAVLVLSRMFKRPKRAHNLEGDHEATNKKLKHEHKKERKIALDDFLQS